jgi:hypothetical protein
MDDTMKVWDIRNTSGPVIAFEDLPNYDQTHCIFSPDDRFIVTGTSGSSNTESTGLLIFYDKATMSQVKQIGVQAGASVHTLMWHPKINQLVVGTSNGKVHVFYDPKLSTRGAMLGLSRRPREKDPNDYQPPRPVLVPNALPMYYETFSSKRKEAREAYNPAKSTGLTKQQIRGMGADPGAKGHAGRLGGSATQYLLKNYISYDNKRAEDPRDALLKYADEAEKDPVSLI